MENRMRRKDRMMSDEDAKKLLLKGEYGILSTVSPDGQPYGVPLNYSYSVDGIYFHCALDGHKLENIEGNNRVSFSVVGNTEVLPDKFSTKFESVIVIGKASEVTGEEKQKGLVELLKKYSDGFMKEGLEYIAKSGDKTRVYKIVIESMSGKARR